MSIKFWIPIAEYQALISVSDQNTLEYKKLGSGVMINQIVHFLVDETTAQSLYQYALARCPAAAQHIQRSMSESGDEIPF
jgi:hypothetical protein